MDYVPEINTKLDPLLWSPICDGFDCELAPRRSQLFPSMIFSYIIVDLPKDSNLFGAQTFDFSANYSRQLYGTMIQTDYRNTLITFWN